MRSHGNRARLSPDAQGRRRVPEVLPCLIDTSISVPTCVRLTSHNQGLEWIQIGHTNYKLSDWALAV
jgi:hypothetical protein